MAKSKLWLLLVLLLALALAERGFRSLYSERWSPTGSAQWIWASSENPDAGVAFFAVRDFELAGYPGRARVSVIADEEYFLYVNGTLLGSARYYDGASLDTYEVGFLLRPGLNRVAAELRSSRGLGGFLLELEVEGKEALRIGTDASWKIARAFNDDLLTAGGALQEPEAAEVWAQPPVGRWGYVRRGNPTPLFSEVVVARGARHARRAVPENGGGRWRELDPPDHSSPPLGRRVTFDWGREVVGYPNVVFGRKWEGRGMVFAGLEPPDPQVDRPVTYLLKPPGRKSWSDSRPRTFRYLTVIATQEMVGARVLPLVPELAASAMARAAAPPGVFGIEPPGLRPPIEDEIRSELESLASVPGG